MIRCLIVEDEPLPAQIMEEYIEQTPDLVLAAHCTDALYAIEFLKTNEVDLIFLDIHLPSMKGLSMLGLLKQSPLIVVTTAYHEYAVQGFEQQVFDYLLKPIGYERFLQTIEKARKKLQPATTATASSDYIFFNVNRRQVKVRLADILYVESMKDYSKIYTAKQCVVTQMTLSEMENILPANRFVRMHRSYMINVRQVTAYNSTEVELGLVTLPIGKSYAERLTEMLSTGG